MELLGSEVLFLNALIFSGGIHVLSLLMFSASSFLYCNVVFTLLQSPDVDIHVNCHRNHHVNILFANLF